MYMYNIKRFSPVRQNCKNCKFQNFIICTECMSNRTTGVCLADATIEPLYHHDAYHAHSRRVSSRVELAFSFQGPYVRKINGSSERMERHVDREREKKKHVGFMLIVNFKRIEFCTY